MAVKKILIISMSYLDRDPRVFRQIQFLLHKNYTLCAAGYNDPGIENVKFIPISTGMTPGNYITRKVRRLLDIRQNHLPFIECRIWNSATIQALHLLKEHKWDLIVANDYSALPLAAAIANHTKAKLIFDAHEYSPRQMDHSFRFRMIEQPYRTIILKHLLPRVDAMITVNEGIALEYKKIFGKECSVITNAPFYENMEPSSTSNEQLRIIHHGCFAASRAIDEMIYLIDMLDDRFTLDLMLVCNNLSSIKPIRELANQNDRIRLRVPVPMQEISATINKYDIGLYMLSPKSFNQFMALPNKIFEYIQGRLAVAIWPSPEMARIVNEYDCGIVAEEFSLKAMADKLNRITSEDIIHYKNKSHSAAQTLCAESNRDIFIDTVQHLIGD